jgi:hypothetical protein
LVQSAAFSLFFMLEEEELSLDAFSLRIIFITSDDDVARFRADVWCQGHPA